jgi:membrane-associated phospholipid phosphatase
MTYHLIGLFLFIFGLSHKLETTSRWDFQSVRLIQDRLGRLPFLAWFEEIWVFGRTTFTLVILLLLTGYNWKLGLSALAVLGIVAGLELVIKSTFNRSRPYSVHKDIQMLQPREPTDSSFPSGDTLRIWFLVLILGIALGNNLAFGILSVLLAVLVTMGRLIFGVHYLTDALAGIGLGFLAAGTTLWLWQSLHLL